MASEMKELIELELDATPPPWGWTTYGDKCNAAILGTFYQCDDKCTPIGGHIDTEKWDDKSGEYKRVADYDETIASKDDNARFADFEFIARLRNAFPSIVSAITALEAERDQWKARAETAEVALQSRERGE